MTNPGSILITGASSGIGAALARAYAETGVHLFLGGRNRERLDAVASACRAAGAAAEGTVCDVTDAPAMAGWIAASDGVRPLELVIANAGVSAGSGGGEDAAQVRRILAVNIDGVVNTVQPAIEAMRPRRLGQVAIMSSLAAFVGFSGAPAYSASKAAVRIWGEALRATCAADGIAVSVVLPGYVKTPMTDVNRFRMPMLMSAEEAAARVRRGLARNRGRIAFPFSLYALTRLAGVLPLWMTDPINRRLPKKV